MRATYSALTMLFFFSLPALAVPCTGDGGCGYGKRCSIQMGERMGQCVAVSDKFGNIDRNAIGTASEAKSADNSATGKSSCNWDADCSPGAKCVRKGKEVSGVCVR